MKQYRHKPTNVLATLQDGFYLFEGANIPAFVVEKGQDWRQLTTELLFKDDVGNDVFRGDAWFYIVMDGKMQIKSTSTTTYSGVQTMPVKRFLNQRDAQFFINSAKPVLSFAELSEIPNLKLTKKALAAIETYVNGKFSGNKQTVPVIQ